MLNPCIISKQINRGNLKMILIGFGVMITKNIFL